MYASGCWFEYHSGCFRKMFEWLSLLCQSSSAGKQIHIVSIWNVHYITITFPKAECNGFLFCFRDLFKMALLLGLITTFERHTQIVIVRCALSWFGQWSRSLYHPEFLAMLHSWRHRAFRAWMQVLVNLMSHPTSNWDFADEGPTVYRDKYSPQNPFSSWFMS